MDKSLISAKAPRGRDSRQVPVGLIKFLKENTCGLIFFSKYESDSPLEYRYFWCLLNPARSRDGFVINDL